MINSAKPSCEKEGILTVSFYDKDGSELAGNTNANLLNRLDSFSISINQGERIYNCINVNYLGLNNINHKIFSFNEKNFTNIEKRIINSNFSFKEALEIELSNINNNVPNVNYENILSDYIKNKYTMFSQYFEQIERKKEKRVNHFLNLFFYLSLAQYLSLNVSTFIILNWDIMEPITQMLTWGNLIIGYYYWALTDTDYEIEAMTSWAKNKRVFNRSFIERNLEEKELLMQALSNTNKH